ncbi:LbetaH domain-containing protein [Spirosoma humi]
MKGKVKINADTLYFGMIRLGGYDVSIYENNSGIIWENHGGEVIFNKNCVMGNGAAISIGENGTLNIGENFKSTVRCKIIAYKLIKFGENTLVGWDCLFVDTDFHALTNIETGNKMLAVAPIIIGKNNWFAMKCIILKNTETPDFCTIGANSLLNKKYNKNPYCLIAGNPASIKRNGLYRNPNHDKVDY